MFQVWDNVKRNTKAKVLSGSQDEYSQLDHIVLDIIGPSIGIKTEPLELDQDDLDVPDHELGQANLDESDHLASSIHDSDYDRMDSEDVSNLSDYTGQNLSDFTGQKVTVFTNQHRMQLALLVQKNKEVLLGSNISNAAKNRKWEEIYTKLTSQGAQIKSLQSLRWVKKDYQTMVGS